jgi:hypothetical protein
MIQPVLLASYFGTTTVLMAATICQLQLTQEP